MKTVRQADGSWRVYVGRHYICDVTQRADGQWESLTPEGTITGASCDAVCREIKNLIKRTVAA